MYIILTEVLKWKIIKFFVWFCLLLIFTTYLSYYVDQGYRVKVNERVHGQNIQVTKHF